MTKLHKIFCQILIAGVFLGYGYARGFESMHIHGFISQGYLQSDKNNYLAETEDGSFQFNEMGINFLNQTTKKLNIGVQFFARDLGETDNDAIVVDWAYADYHFKDFLGIRAGKIKNRFGLYHENRDVDMLRACILLPSSVYSEFMRDTLMAINGIGIYGEVMDETYGYFNYNLLAGTNNIRPDGGTASYIEGSRFNIDDVTVENAYSGSFFWNNPGGQLKLGGSFLFATAADFCGETTSYYESSSGLPAGTKAEFLLRNVRGWVVSLEYTIQSLMFASEYMMRIVDTQTILNAFALPKTKNGKSDGYYASVSYRINPLIEIGAYYSAYFPNKDDRDGDDFPNRIEAWRKDTAVSVRFDINENWLFKLEGHYIDGVAPMLNKLNPDGFHRYWKLYVAKLSFVF